MGGDVGAAHSPSHTPTRTSLVVFLVHSSFVSKGARNGWRSQGEDRFRIVEGHLLIRLNQSRLRSLRRCAIAANPMLMK
jgi:hypothetical protein